MIKPINPRKMKKFLDSFYNNPQEWYDRQIDGDFEFDEETQLRIIEEKFYVKNNECAIKYIKNPTKTVCLKAVKRYDWVIGYIENPSKEVFLEAIKYNCSAIQYIRNLTEEMQLEAVKEDGEVLKYIKNPTEKVCLEAIKQNSLVIEYIENQTDEMKLEAIKRFGLSIEYIKNPTKEMQLEAVKKDCLAIQYIKNPTEEMCLEAVKKNYFTIEYIKKEDQSFDIVEAFFDHFNNGNVNDSYYNYYKFLSSEFITKKQGLIMIQDNPGNINLLSEEVQKEILEMKPELRKYLGKDNNLNLNEFF